MAGRSPPRSAMSPDTAAPFASPVRLPNVKLPASDATAADSSTVFRAPCGIASMRAGARGRSQASVCGMSGADRRASPAKRPSASRPVRCRVALPGSTASASRRVNPFWLNSNPVRRWCSVPPASCAASADNSMPVGSGGWPSRTRGASQASRSSWLVARAASNRNCGSSRTATAPRAGAPPISSSRSWAITRPLPALTCPSARQGRAGAGSSSDRSGPRPEICPASSPSALIWPDNVPPVPTAEPFPSRLIATVADPSSPAWPSRPVICHGRPMTEARPAADSSPVAASTRSSP